MRKYIEKIILGIAVLCILSSTAFAQGDTTRKASVEIKDTVKHQAVLLGSPYLTLWTHIHYLQPAFYNPELAAQSFSPKHYSNEQRKSLAIQLYQIYAAKGFYLNVKKVPTDSNYQDTTGKYKYIVSQMFPQIFLERQAGKWYYSERAVAQIEKIHAEIYPLGVSGLLNLLPKFNNQSIIGVYYWQLLGLAILLGFSFVLFYFVSLFLRAIIQRITHNKTGEYLLFKTEAKGVAKALSLFLMTAFISFFLPILQLPILLSSVLVFILNVAMPTFAFLGLYRFVDLLSIALQYMAKSTQNPLDNQLLPLLRKTLKLIVSVVGLIYVFKAANVDLTTLIAGLSIGGLALALAAQDSVKNFLGSITILLDSTFYIGDQIEADNKSGIVEEVGFRSTKIRTTDGSIITIPNAKLIDTAIVNHGYKTYKRFTPKVIISANSGTLPIQAFTQAIQKMIDEHPQTHDIGNKVYVNNMNGRQIDIAVSVLYDVEKDEGLVREQIVLGIVQLAHQHKIILL